jgi:predicted N-acetyltransferase YhbS
MTASVSGSPWIRYSWQTASLGPSPSGQDLIRRATREEGEEVLKVLHLSLSMDPVWNDAYAQAVQHLREEVARLFNEEDPLCLVIQKGNRLIAASLMDPSTEAPSHLVSGPAVLMEYRNRGIGSRMLHSSLTCLAEKGLATATGITREKTVAAKYVYPKFGGSGERVVVAKSA